MTEEEMAALIAEAIVPPDVELTYRRSGGGWLISAERHIEDHQLIPISENDKKTVRVLIRALIGGLR